MRILKLFYEEPVYIEALSADADPDARRRDRPPSATGHLAFDALLPADFAGAPPPEDAQSPDALARPMPSYRVYVAGTDLAADRVGATALDEPRAFVLPLAEVFAEHRWFALRSDDAEELRAAEVPARLERPEQVYVLVAARAPVERETLEAVATDDRRAAFAALPGLLKRAALVAYPEPAHDGHDWSLYAPEPLVERLKEAFARHPVEGLRRFAAPYQRMRGEHRFYFERWALDDLPDEVEEV